MGREGVSGVDAVAEVERKEKGGGGRTEGTVDLDALDTRFLSRGHDGCREECNGGDCWWVK